MCMNLVVLKFVCAAVMFWQVDLFLSFALLV